MTAAGTDPTGATKRSSRSTLPPTGAAPPTLDQALSTLLADHPTAVVAAIGEDGATVPVPPSVPVGDGHRVVDDTSTLELVVPADRVVIVRLFAETRHRGMVSAPVRPVDDEAGPVMVHMVDAREHHGVLVVVFGEPFDAAGEEMGRPAIAYLPPRLVRARKDPGAAYVWVDEAFTQLLGWAPDEVLGRRSLEFIHADDHETAIANWIEMLGEPGLNRRTRVRHRHRDGHWVWIEITNTNRLDDDDHQDVITEMVNISEEMAAHEALRQREQLLHQMAETVPLGLLQVDPLGQVLFTNGRLHEILGTRAAASLDELLDAVFDDDRPALDAAIDAALHGPGSADVELRVGTTDRPAVRYCSLRLRALPGDGGGAPTGVIGCLEDVTESVRMRRELEVQATYDPLTECRNRASTLTALATVMQTHHQRRGSGTAVAFVDLDRFKPVNDKLGHAAGDQLLAIVAQRLQDAVRDGDLVGRIGGDEFLVVCAHVRRPIDAMKIGRTLAARLTGDVRVVGKRTPLAASIGVAWSDDPEADPDLLMAAADAAMYESKRSGDHRPVLARAPFGMPAVRVAVED